MPYLVLILPGAFRLLHSTTPSVGRPVTWVELPAMPWLVEAALRAATLVTTSFQVSLAFAPHISLCYPSGHALSRRPKQGLR